MRHTGLSRSLSEEPPLNHSSSHCRGHKGPEKGETQRSQGPSPYSRAVLCRDELLPLLQENPVSTGCDSDQNPKPLCL